MFRPGRAGLRGLLTVAGNAWFGLLARLRGAGTAVFAGVAMLVGADMFALIVASAAIWPVGISLLAAALGLAFWVRRGLHRRVHRRRPGR